MTKKEIRNMVKVVYDQAVLKGKCEFAPDILDGFYIETSTGYLSGVSFVKLYFVSGWMTLNTDDYNRKKIIDVFTDFLWMMEI